MKKYFLLCTIILFSPIVSLLAQNEPDFAWAKRIGDNSASNSQIFSPVVAVDAQGNSYLAGGFFGQSFMLDGITLTSPIPLSGSNRPCNYIAKYDPSGQIIWAKSMTNIIVTLGPQNGHGLNRNKIIVDQQGNIYFCALGAVNGHCIINGHYLTDPNATFTQIPNQYKMFLAKLNSDGNVLWTKNIHHTLWYGSPFYNSTNEIHFDLDGNINMTAGGYHNAITDSDDTLSINTSEAFMFLTKYSPAGEVLTHKKLIGTYPKGQFGTEHIRADASGNLYRWSNRNANNPKRLYRYDAAGELSDSVDLNINISVVTGYYGSRSNLNAFAVNSTGDIFIGGAYVGNITIDGSVYTGSGNNNSDAVLFKLAAPGYGVDWVKTYQTTNHDAFNQLLTDGLGNSYALGINTSGAYRMMLQKYTGDGTLLWDLPLGTGSNVQPTSLCLSQNGGNIWVGGLFSEAANFASGYQWTTPANNHYNGFLAQYGICNTSDPAIHTPITTKLCGQENITLSAHLNDPGLTYFWSTPNGTVSIGSSETTTELTVTQPGKYYLVAQEDTECYGKSQEIWITQGLLPDNGITENNNTLTATETTQGTTWQWLDCNNNHAPIAGADQVSFTPAQNGSYAVILTSQEGCADTSVCYVISTVGLKEELTKQEIMIYPNPANQEITIQGDIDIQSVCILDVQGKQVLTATSSTIDISSLVPGVYLVEIVLTNNSSQKRKIIKE